MAVAVGSAAPPPRCSVNIVVSPVLAFEASRKPQLLACVLSVGAVTGRVSGALSAVPLCSRRCGGVMDKKKSKAGKVKWTKSEVRGRRGCGSACFDTACV